MILIRQLVAVLVALACANAFSGVSVWAQSTDSAAEAKRQKQTAKIKKKIADIGVNKRVIVTTQSSQKFKGSIVEVNDTAFVLQPIDQTPSQNRNVAYDEVKKVEPVRNFWKTRKGMGVVGALMSLGMALIAVGIMTSEL